MASSSSASGSAPPPSLVRYDPPVLVSESIKKKASLRKGAKSGPLPPVEAKNSNLQTEDILNAILPPREWEENGQKWMQSVSSTPSTRLDIINLQDYLDQQLMRRNARETGICPIREELYAQCFDEIIRQVAINCTERGFLLLRVRDEMRMTIDAYRTLYESAVAFGMRKALQAEQGKSELEKKVSQLDAEKEELLRKLDEFKARVEANAQKEKERKAQDEKAHQDEVNFWKKQNQQLKAQLDVLSAPQK